MCLVFSKSYAAEYSSHVAVVSNTHFMYLLTLVKAQVCVCVFSLFASVSDLLALQSLLDHFLAGWNCKSYIRFHQYQRIVYIVD